MSGAPFFNEHEWVGLHINQSGSLLNKIDIESCYVFELVWHWVFLSILYCLQQGPKHSFYILTLSTTTFFVYNSLSIYLLFLGLSQKPLPWLPFYSFDTQNNSKMRFIIRFKYWFDITKSFQSACLMLQSTKKWAIRMRK